MSFRSDFAGFVGGAILCSLPVMAFVTVTVYDRATERQSIHGTRPPKPTIPLTHSTPRQAGAMNLEDCLTNALPPAHLGDAEARRAGSAPSVSGQCGSLQGSGCWDLASARCPGSSPVLARSLRVSIPEAILGTRHLRSDVPMRRERGAIAQGAVLEALSRPAANLCGVEPDLYWRVILRESGGRHYAADGSVLRSSAGAVGAAQVKPSTARELGLDAFDVWENLLAGACVLRGHYDASGSWEVALHSYHAGRWRKRTTAATRAYAEDVMGGTQ